MSTDAGITLAFASARKDRRAGRSASELGRSASELEKARPRLEASSAGPGAGRLPTAPGNRAAAEEGVRLAYRAAGLSPPQIVWAEGPVALAEAWSRAASRDGVGANARSIVFDLPFCAALGEQRVASLRRQLARDRSLAASAAMQSAVLEEIGDTRPPLLGWIGRRGRSAGGLRIGRRPTLADCGCGPHELLGARLAADVHEQLYGHVGPALRGHRLIADNAGWFVPHQGVCWLGALPDVLAADRRGRLHCASGPALRYPDGWALHAWKGTPVPAWMVTQPGLITLPWIDAQIDPRIRHAMIDILTPARFIAAGGADATRDRTGTLWRRSWSHRGVVIDRWAAVEVAGKGLFRTVPAELATPSEAFAWLFGPRRPVASADVLHMRGSCSPGRLRA